MKAVLVVLLTLCVLLGVVRSTYASSSYVLPYPGVMPGNKLYKLAEIFDEVKKYYSFGDFARFSYNLSESDKYLVEAKTLFEYNQYPLALTALRKSDSYFKKVLPSLKQASKNGKDISEKLIIFKQARSKHIEVLEGIQKNVPESFLWVDEKKLPVQLDIWGEINSSLNTLHE